jgi:hypothetical protein
MEQRIQEILAERGTKTSKIRKLILLGLTRVEVARLLTNGNYGQVQNVYKRMKDEGLLENINLAINTPVIELPTFFPRAFDKEFGVEFEAYNVNKTTLRNKLVAAGINCEVAGYTHATTRYWKIVSDGSLSGTNTFELVSPILRGEQGLDEVMKVCRVLKQCNAKVNRSCGTHVHINARNFSLEQWKRIYINYARLETVIDGFMANSRRANNNSYCRGFFAIRNFESMVNTATDLDAIGSIMDHNRYFKINPTSYSRHNTCEFRQHGGTTDYIKISSWIRFLSNLVDYSQSHLVNERTLDGLRAFNNIELVDYYKYRTLELIA